MVTSQAPLVRSGAIAGVAGGLVIAAVGMSLSAARGTGFWSLPNGIGGIVAGPDAGSSRDFGAITLEGVVLHMVLSAVFGIITVFISRQVTKEYLWTGVVTGLVLWLLNYYAIGAVIPGAHALAELNPVWMGGMLHALFGAVTGVIAKRLDMPVASLAQSAA